MLSVALIALVPFPTGSDDWPAWRGPQGNGIARGNPPIEFAEDHNLRWKTPIPGKGLGVPVVWGDRVYVTTAVGTGKVVEVEPEAGDSTGREGRRPGGRDRGSGGPMKLEEQDFVVLALDRATGKVVWEKKVVSAMPHEGTHPDGSFASPSPVFDGETLYAPFGSFGIFALSRDGEVRWQRDLGDMSIRNGFGEGSSPVLVGDLLILNWDHEGDSFLVGLDRKTGQERWRTARPSGTNWSSPIVVHTEGKDVVVVAGSATIGYDPATGKELWRNEGGGGAIASPIAIDELVVWVSGGRRGGQLRALVALPEKAEAEEPLLWSIDASVPGIPSPLCYDGRIYFLKDNNGLLSVLDPVSGEVTYGPERLDAVSDVYASLVAASGHLYVAGRDGTVEVLSMGSEIGTVAVNHLEDRFDASPAVAGDELFLRGHENLYCLAAQP